MVGGAEGVGGRAARPRMGLGMTPVWIFSSTASRCSWIWGREGGGRGGEGAESARGGGEKGQNQLGEGERRGRIS